MGLLHLVDYGKGCYVGQEIMARTEGKEVPYRLVGLRALEGGEAPAALTLEGKRVGEAKRLLETPSASWASPWCGRRCPWGRRWKEAGAVPRGGPPL